MCEETEHDLVLGNEYGENGAAPPAAGVAFVNHPDRLIAGKHETGEQDWTLGERIASEFHFFDFKGNNLETVIWAGSRLFRWQEAKSAVSIETTSELLGLLVHHNFHGVAAITSCTHREMQNAGRRNARIETEGTGNQSLCLLKQNSCRSCVLLLCIWGASHDCPNTDLIQRKERE